ncbi:VanZ family protein [Paenibacillus sp. LHD-117]|uniref:VanZ family protein n=1 Tax=Paenibacillus sp. LHD-117 TaxID=3071412 RepID=UPI0027DFED2B|nr:VanZ family protein [Paenibacillus sp. LHD-117]MDQ6421763.1 VanZ family protein [Paenibacillus sp. LHD-117]
MNQVSEMVSTFCLFFLIQLPVLIVYNLIRNRNVLKHIRIIIAIAYVMVIAELTLWSWSPVTGQTPIRWSDISYNFIPFNSILGSWNHSYYLVGIRNIVGNIFLLLPLAIILKTKGSFRVFWVGCAISLAIEMVQGLLSKYGFINRRSVDVDDLILNTAGFYMGYLIRSVLTHFYRRVLYGKSSLMGVGGSHASQRRDS